MKKYLIIWEFHDTYVEFFNNTDDARIRYYKIYQEHRFESSRDFKINVYELKHEIEFV